MEAIPPGWTSRQLGKLLAIQNGFAFSSSYFSQKGGVPLIRIRDLKDGSSTKIKYNGPYDDRFIVQTGDYLIGMDGEFRCYRWTGPSALLNQRVCRLIDFSTVIDPDFVGWGLDVHLLHIEENTPFATVRHLSAKSVKKIDFAFPPLQEQRRIVSCIKECMERVEEIARLRASAIMNASGALPSLLNETFNDLKSFCNTTTIDRVALETRYGTSQKCHTRVDGMPILRIPNVADGFVNFDDLKYCTLLAGEFRRIELQDDDLLFVRTNGSRDLVGRCAVYRSDGEIKKCGFASYLIRVRLNQQLVHSDYLKFFLNSTQGREQIDERRRTSAGQFNVNSENLRSISFPCPNIEVQLSIIERLREHESRLVQLQKELEGAQEVEHGLRRAVLRKAFAGEL